MTENAYELLRLEQRLESYQRMHQEELDEIRRAIVELRNQILFNIPPVPKVTLKQEPPVQLTTDEHSQTGLNNGNQHDRIKCTPPQNL